MRQTQSDLCKQSVVKINDESYPFCRYEPFV